jgi:glucose-6-phosphate isomerase
MAIKLKSASLAELFAADPARRESLSIQWQDMYIDFSKNLITADILRELIKIAELSDLKGKIKAMFSGEKINKTEDRSVLHIALRNLSGQPIYVEKTDVMPNVLAELEKMKQMAERIRQGKWLGYSGKKIKHIINIGIGGSDLGPKMACTALADYILPNLQFHFVSNVDASHLLSVLKSINPEETLFLIASKTFTTIETMTNAHTAREWLVSGLGSEQAVSSHFIAVSVNKPAVINFGIDPATMLGFWDWVGGRFSLTSAIGFSLMIAIGYDHFESMLLGFHQMDSHFKNAPFSQNLPVLMALIGIWNTNFLETSSLAILPYCHHLRDFPAYLQQAEMESNGKSVDQNGNYTSYQTCPIIFGGCGTDAQHSFFQLLHQGSQIIPCDFIGIINPNHPLKKHHHILMANFFAQTQALAFGKSEKQVRDEGTSDEQVPFKTFKGNRPSSTILLDRLTPNTLGKLIALYEHKIFVQGMIWNIFSFDQWGVELGKVLAAKILNEFQQTDIPQTIDSSTNYMIRYFKEHFIDK